MNRKYWTINLLCVASLIGLGWKIHRDWRVYAAKNGPQALETHMFEGVPVPPAQPVVDFTAIARQNPFHAERNDVIVEVSTVKALGPPPLVYGSLIIGENRFALLGTEQLPKPERVPEGGTFQGYRLVSVLPESVVIESGSGREEIMLYNALERLHRQASKTVATAKPASLPNATSTGSTPSAEREVVARAEPANSPSSPPASATVAAPPGKQVMQTPFGPMMVDKKP